MTVPMIIALLVTAFMVWLIMTDKVPFGAAPLIACALMVLFGVTDIATAFRGFSNSSIVMLASFMVIIAALQKTRFIAAFKRAILRMASKGGYKAYVLIILVVMLGTSLFGTGSTAYYVMVLGLLSTIPSTQALPRSKFLMPAGFACNHPLIPVNTALQYGYVIAVLEAGGAAMSVSLPKFAIVNLCLSLGFLIWCLVAYKFMPVKDVPATTEAAAEAAEEAEALPAWQEYVIYGCFVAAIIGMVAQSYIGDQGYAVVATAVCVLLLTKIMNFKEICSNLGAPIILMSAGVIGVAEALGVTGLTVTNVFGYGQQKGHEAYFRGVPVEARLLPKLKVEVVVSKVPVDAVVEAARKALYTGHVGDGKIFVYDVENVVKVRTGEEGYDALQDAD